MRTFDAKRPFVFRKTRARFEGNVRSFFLMQNWHPKLKRIRKNRCRKQFFYSLTVRKLKRSDIESLRYRTPKGMYIKCILGSLFIRISWLHKHRNVPGWPVIHKTVRLQSDLQQNKERYHCPDKYLPEPVSQPLHGNPSFHHTRSQSKELH